MKVATLHKNEARTSKKLIMNKNPKSQKKIVPLKCRENKKEIKRKEKKRQIDNAKRE